MPRLEAIDPAGATGKAKTLLDAVQAKLGMVPNILRTMAHAPAALEAYLGMSGALTNGVLPLKLRERIALVVGEANECDYCLAAHGAFAKMAGLSEEDIADSRRGVSPDSKVEAALRFAREMVEKRGWVTDEDVAQVRKAGYGDAEIAEIVAVVSLNVFTNYFNHLAEPEVDFPEVPKHAAA